MSQDKADFGMIGMAVMGRNLSLNVADHGFSVAGYNREPEMLASAVAESKGRILPAASLAELCDKLTRPRRVMMMIKAGAPVDSVLGDLAPHLEAGDVVIDGGNSWYEDTERRAAALADKGIHFLGVGVSGGEDGARNGPSLMPGGNAGAYDHVRPVLEAIAAKTDAGACVTYCGGGGSGHFVKMVHNGIEYADMQFIAEIYDLLKRGAGLGPPAIADVFERYNEGPLESFLIEITAKIFRVKDGEGWLVDDVLDKAGQKGTGRWTAQVALELGVPVPSIAAAIDARVLSSMKMERVGAIGRLDGPSPPSRYGDPEQFAAKLGEALEAAKIIGYAQGMALIAAGSQARDWNVDLKEIARIWKGGCIIRARFLDNIVNAFERDRRLGNLMVDERIAPRLCELVPSLRHAVQLACERGIPVPGLAASLSYFDSYRTPDLPQNLTQAQRDAFGSHTYQKKSDPEGPFIHTDWL
jgi:6-phosphogluconate dehydrogenase